MEVHLLNYGGIIQKLLVPNQYGQIENVVLGYENYKDYETDPYYFGALIGRVAGRIKGAHFPIDGKIYELEQNENENHLHSGPNGFHRVFWDAELIEKRNEAGVKLSYLSKAGENGYPGNVTVIVSYLLNNDNELVVHYEATTDETTPMTLTNHTYFNLSGNGKYLIHDHHVTMNSHAFLELNHELIPTGQILNVKNTLFDFTRGWDLYEGIHGDVEQNKIVGNGYDHYFLFKDNQDGQVEVRERSSGRMLKITTNQPGIVMYTGNNLGEDANLSEGRSRKYLGVCFETQGSPALHDNDIAVHTIEEQ